MLKYVCAVLLVGLFCCLCPTDAYGAVGVETQICSGVADRMPVDSMTTFPADIEQVFVWCRVTGAQDSTSIYLVWKWQEKEIARVELPVKSPNWRTWGSKKMWPTWVGQWDVEILDAQGDILKSVSFTIEPTEPVEPPAKTPADSGAGQ